MEPLLALSITLAVINNLLLRKFRNKGLRGMGDILFFNFLSSVVWIILLFGLNRGKAISLEAVIWGLLYGTLTAAFLLCKMLAFSTGPASITSFIGCSSLLLSTLFGVIYFKESVSVVQIIGMLCLLFSLFLTVFDFKRSSFGERTAKAWYLWGTLFFLCSGATGIVFKLHQKSACRNEVNQMMLSAAVTSACLFLICSVITQKSLDGTLPKIPRSAVVYAVLCGIVSCGYNRLNILLSGLLPSIVFFPTFNGSVILLTSISAAFLFKEKITLRQAIAFTLGISALMMTSGVFD